MMLIGLSTQATYRRQERSQSNSVKGTMPTSHCVDPKRLSLFKCALSFSVSTIVAFIAGRIYSRSLNSTEAFNEIGLPSTQSFPVPAAQSIGPKPNRDAHFIEIVQGGNLLGPSSLATTHQSPSLILESRRPWSTNVGVEAKSRNDDQARKRSAVDVEHLVHSALLSHSNPIRVAILYDVNGLLATEVLKHSTVRDVDVFLLSGAGDATLDDPRLSRIHSDSEGLPAALLQRSQSAGAYDVILWNRSIDQKSLGRDTVLEDAPSLSTAGSLPTILSASAESLSDHGMLCMAAFPTAHDRAAMPDEVEQAGFESLVDYDSGKSGFWLAMKSRESRASWFGRSQAEAELLIRKRLSEVALLSLHSFDAAAFMYQRFPSRITEEVWCRRNVGQCATGHGFDPFVPNTPTSSFRVKHSGVGDRAGRGIFARQRVPKGSTIGMDTCVLGMYVPPATYELLTSMYFPDSTDEYNAAKRASDLLWKPVHGYVYGYGWVDNNYGEPAAGVDASILTYTNHGCNGTYNTGTQLNVTERTATLGIGPVANGYVAQRISGGLGEEYVYNPYSDRNYPDWGCDDTTRALRDIDAGEEVLDNYLVFGGSESGEEWEEVLIELKRMCSGGVGAITQYEESEGRSSSHG